MTDKTLVDALIDLLQTGCNIRQEDIFCTSAEGHGIPEGKTFVEVIREEFAGATFVIMLITHRYYESVFCLCELGASWIAKDDTFPILVPPLDYSQLKAVLSPIQAGYINEKRVLNNLRDRLLMSKLASGSTAKWEVKRDDFLVNFESIKAKLLGPSVVPYATHAELEQRFEELRSDFLAADQDKTALRQTIEDLSKLKDREQVARVMASYGDESQQYKERVRECHSALSSLGDAVQESLYYSIRGEVYEPDTGWGTDDLWRKIEASRERQMVNVHEGRVTPDLSHPKVKKAKDALDALANVLEDATPEFIKSLEEEQEIPVKLSNRDYFRSLLKFGIWR